VARDDRAKREVVVADQKRVLANWNSDFLARQCREYAPVQAEFDGRLRGHGVALKFIKV
jgi:hypothetical protein